ncbi:GRAM domain-containing protein [Terrilactibacillus sp. S3-3]|nr:GRAM domain-containing protein [Terrilactibacillus sp. S3-3]
MQDLEEPMRAINRILTNGETVLSGIPCTYDKKFSSHNTPYYGLLALTSYRIIFYSSLGKPFFELLDYSFIDSVKETNGFFA